MNRDQRSAVFFAASLLALFVVAIACGDYPVASLKGGVTGTGGGTGAGGGAQLPPNTATLPCEILGTAGHECVSAHSTVRLIVPDYAGPLYQVDTGAATLDIGHVEGYADAAAQNTFCAAGCTISIIYDQSGYGNHLTPAPPGSNNRLHSHPAPAADLPVLINGRSVYGIKIRPGLGYRAACTECDYPPAGEYPSGVPIDDEPETQYMVTSHHDLVPGCCFDYGNAEVTSNNDGNGTMETVYFGMGVIWGTGSGAGPWVMADMENGLYAGWENNSDQGISTNTPLQFDFVNAVVVGDTADKNAGKGRFALYGGDATAVGITRMYDGIRPEKLGYVPMDKQGSVILGIGGDASGTAGGRFYEGVIALGAATEEVVGQLHDAIAGAAYGK